MYFAVINTLLKQFKKKLKYKITEIMMSNNNLYLKETTNMNSEIFDIENNQYIEEPWTIIESYFKGQQLERFVRHQLESYNNFVGYQIIKTIEMFNPVHIKSENDFDAKSGKYSLEMFIIFHQELSGDSLVIMAA